MIQININTIYILTVEILVKMPIHFYFKPVTRITIVHKLATTIETTKPYHNPSLGFVNELNV